MPDIGDFICRSRRSAKIAIAAPGTPGDFRRSRRSAYKIADIWHVSYRRLNSPAFAKCARSRDFYGHCCESPVKPTHQVGRFYHMTFQNCHIAAIGEKNRQVCPHQSVAKISCEFRWRSNSPRSAYKITRCVAGFKLRFGSLFSVVVSKNQFFQSHAFDSIQSFSSPFRLKTRFLFLVFNSEITAIFSLRNNLSSFCLVTFPGRAVYLSLHVQTIAREIFCVIGSDWLQLLIHIHA